MSSWSGLRSRKRTYAQKSNKSRSVTPFRIMKKRRVAVTKASYGKVLVGSRGVGAGPGVKTQLKTVIWQNYNVGGIATDKFTFSLSTGSAFDPTGGLSAIQPAEFDQWASLYGRYVVLGGSVKVSIQAPSAVPFVAAMYPDIDGTVKTTFQDAASQDWSIVKQGSGTGGNPVILYQKFSHAALLGKKGPVTSEDNGALVTADPTANQFIHHNVFVQSAATWTANTVVPIMIEIIQDVYFDRKKTVVDA